MTEFISPEDMDNTVALILQTLPDGIDGFRQASQMYASDFFDGENPEFVRKLAGALKQKYKDHYNSLWEKLAGE